MELLMPIKKDYFFDRMSIIPNDKINKKWFEEHDMRTLAQRSSSPARNVVDTFEAL